VTQGIAWSIHLWLGAIALAGATGLLLTFPLAPASTAGAGPAQVPPT
jgi:hypothetical protein